MDMKKMDNMTSRNDMDKLGDVDRIDDMDGLDDADGLDGMDRIKDIEKFDNMDESDDMDELDKLIQEAFEKMVELGYERRPKKFPRHRFSRRFRRNMDELLRTGRAPEEAGSRPAGGFSLLELMRPVRSRRIILVVAVLMLLLFGTTAGSMNPIIVWMHDSWMEQHGDYVELQNREEEDSVSQESFCKYELSEVPEGYEVVRKVYDEDVGIYYMTYADKDGNLLIFNQGKKENGNLGNVTANRKDIEEVSVGDLTGFYIHDAESSNLVLSDEEYMLVFSGDLSKEEFLEIASHLHAVE